MNWLAGIHSGILAGVTLGGVCVRSGPRGVGAGCGCGVQRTEEAQAAGQKGELTFTVSPAVQSCAMPGASLLFPLALPQDEAQHPPGRACGPWLRVRHYVPSSHSTLPLGHQHTSVMGVQAQALRKLAGCWAMLLLRRGVTPSTSSQ